MSLGSIWLLILFLSIILLQSAPSSIDPDGFRRVAESMSITASANGLMLTKQNYEQQTHTPLSPLTWKQDLIKIGNGYPINSGFSWSYGTKTGKGNYFCLSSISTPSKYSLAVLNKVQSRLGYISFVNATCGALVDLPISTNISTLSSLSLTIYTGD